MDGIHSGSGCGCSQKPPLLVLRLILAINRAAQYVVYGGSRFRRELCAGRYSFNHGGGLTSADRLPNISPEVAVRDVQRGKLRGFPFFSLTGPGHLWFLL